MTALVFMTNKATCEVMDRFAQIHAQTHQQADSFVLLDAGADGAEVVWRAYLLEHGMQSVRLIPFVFRQIVSELGIVPLVEGRIVPGSVHMPLVLLARGLSHEQFWFVEDDVLYTGNWGELIGMLESDNSDLLCSHICSRKQRPHWPLWQSLKIPKSGNHMQPAIPIHKAFLPIFRASSRALVKLLEHQKAGWVGHFEALFPTILYHVGYSVRDLNDAARCVIYTKGPMELGDGEGNLSSLRFRPPIADAEIQTSQGPRIFHPIKPAPKPTHAAARFIIGIRATDPSEA